MIVLCERCRTRFQLDDRRIPAGGIQVRCSRCEHGFFLGPPGAGERERRGAPEEVTRSARPDVDEARLDRVVDPASRSGSDGLDASSLLGEDRGSGREADPESDWEFNTDFPAPDLDQEERPRPGRQRPGEQAGEEHSQTPSFEDVGDPESWNLLEQEGSSPDEIPPGKALLAEAPAAALEELSPATSVAPARFPAEEGPAPEQAAPACVEPASASRAGSLLGWVATALLLVISAHGSLRVSAVRSSERPGRQVVAGLSVEDVRTRRIENALGGPLYLVSGRLRNAAREPRSTGSVLSVSLLREDGVAISGSRAPLGRTLRTERLRWEDPEQLKAELEQSARTLALRPLAPGETLAFDALFEVLPPEAASLRVQTTPFAARGADPMEPGQLDAPLPSEPTPLRSSRTSPSPESAPPSWE